MGHRRNAAYRGWSALTDDQDRYKRSKKTGLNRPCRQDCRSTEWSSFPRLTSALPAKNHFIKRKLTFRSQYPTAIIAVTILQGCAGTTGTQCAKPILTPSDATRATTSVTVRIATKTAWAYLRYTLDGSTPTGGSSGKRHANSNCERESLVQGRAAGKTLKAIAYKPGLADSAIAEGTYVYESPY